MKRVILFLALYSSFTCLANPIKGKVFGYENSEKITLPGANIYWAGTTIGTMADENGVYTIKPYKSSNLLVFSFVGFKTDTIQWKGEETVDAILDQNHELKEVTIIQKDKGIYISKI
ncbi:MAG: carboxypeptidase-like regulatory domain-containing protein, partial [Verrucomicrobia bacterium]|nr:carboxypeptidase-like regulatory domain-containing protein [Prolixibacteraceae bacterium]